MRAPPRPLVRLVRALLDLTARRRAEAALRESARQLRLERAVLEAVLQQAPVGVSIAGAPPGAPTMINACAERMIGHGVGSEGPGEARYARYGALHLDGRPYLPAEYPTMRALRAGEIVRAEEMGYRNARTGEVRRIEVSSAPVRDAEGVTQAAVTILVDVEDARQAWERLQEAQRFSAALLDLGDRLRGASLVAEVLRSTLEVVGPILNASRVGFGSLDAGGRVGLEADWTAAGGRDGVAHHGFTCPDILRDAMLEGRPVIVADTHCGPRVDDDPAWPGAGVRAMAGMPVRERGRTTMLLFVHACAPRAWTEAERAFLRGVIDRVESGMARLRAEEQQRLLNRELSHRMKNLLAMVQSIAAQTMRTAAGLDEAQAVLSGRLVALGKAHDLLLGGEVTSTRLDAVVHDALQVHRDHAERFTVSGPDIEIGADPALALSLSLHELATNAAKYGALSTGGGRVSIGWEIVEAGAEPSLHLVWTERGGPPVRPPQGRGFGSRFLERALVARTGGETTMDYRETGVTFSLTAPLDAIAGKR